MVITSPDKIEVPEEDYLYVQASKIPDAGMGLFTAVKIFRNEIISAFTGDILPDKEAELRAKNREDQYFINLLNGKIMDSKHTPCFAKYANDAEGLGNSGYKNNATITLDDDNRVCLVAVRNIKAGEEIFTGYGEKYWKNQLK